MRHGRDDEGEQAPRGDVVDGGAGDGDGADARLRSRSRSTRMRARTGNAVTDIAAPMKSANEPEGHAGRRLRRVQTYREGHPEDERRHDARVRGEHRGPASPAQQRRVELEPDQEHEEDDAVLAQHLQVGQRLGREERGRDVAGASQPSSDGPRRMPPSTSPITCGCPTARTATPSSRAAARMTTISTVTTASRCSTRACRSASAQRAPATRAAGAPVGGAGPPCCAPIQTRPPRKCSCFQIGTISFSRSISQRQAANASARWPAETAIADARLADGHDARSGAPSRPAGAASAAAPRPRARRISRIGHARRTPRTRAATTRRPAFSLRVVPRKSDDRAGRRVAHRARAARSSAIGARGDRGTRSALRSPAGRTPPRRRRASAMRRRRRSARSRRSGPARAPSSRVLGDERPPERADGRAGRDASAPRPAPSCSRSAAKKRSRTRTRSAPHQPRPCGRARAASSFCIASSTAAGRARAARRRPCPRATPADGARQHRRRADLLRTRACGRARRSRRGASRGGRRSPRRSCRAARARCRRSRSPPRRRLGEQLARAWRADARRARRAGSRRRPRGGRPPRAASRMRAPLVSVSGVRVSLTVTTAQRDRARSPRVVLVRAHRSRSSRGGAARSSRRTACRSAGRRTRASRRRAGPGAAASAPASPGGSAGSGAGSPRASRTPSGSRGGAADPRACADG